MSHPDPQFSLDDDFIDHIVDGGLTPAELRAAIDRLDREPHGWKRCALAFLEAECWGESFRALDQPSVIRVPTESPTATQADERVRRYDRALRRVAIAAGIAAVSFAIGWTVHPVRPSAAVHSLTQPMVPAVATHLEVPRPSHDGPQIDDVIESLGEFARPPENHRLPPKPGDGIVAVAHVRLGSGSDTAEVPLLAGPDIDEQWLRDQPSRLSEHQQAELERLGYQVDRQRRIITATLADGRRVTVPVDQVQLRYTGNNPL
ncbi:MAG: hypothetical protein ACLQGP_26030 [Isosphaeraceae bacterium]